MSRSCEKATGMIENDFEGEFEKTSAPFDLSYRVEVGRSKTKRNEHSTPRERAASRILGTCPKSFELERASRERSRET